LSSTRQVNHDVKPAGDSAGQPLNQVFERYAVGAKQKGLKIELRPPKIAMRNDRAARQVVDLPSKEVSGYRPQQKSFLVAEDP